ncbi:glycosyltransferase [Salinibacter ruber]|uniref:glycosyltransferase n=1 Tax=Salinibacter ruber TaxID=146919 RepID=UPI0021697C43|nr:glycosyltransferase involved in cell wall biosynthesis [Salinibacter ruber]
MSVVIPCYNNETYVGNAIESVLKQDYSPLEVVVVNDGSTDDSLNEIQRFDEHVKIISTPNRGAPAARNTGLETATGSLIKFLDADDELFEGTIRRQVERHVEMEEDAIVFGEGVWFEESSGRAFRRRFREREAGEDFVTYVFRMNPQTSLSLYTSRLLNRVEGFDESLSRAQDLDLNLRLCLAGGKHKYVPDDVTRIRMHEGEDRISSQAILQDEPRSALKRLRKWIDLIDNQDRNSKGVRKEIAQSTWAKGRAVLRAGHLEAAQDYFIFASKLHKNPLSDKSKMYEITTRVFGPRIAEHIAGIARKIGLDGTVEETAPTDNSIEIALQGNGRREDK